MRFTRKFITTFNCRTRLFENLRMLPHAPGVQVQAIPEDGAVIEDSEAEEKINPDERLPQRDLDKRLQHENEYSDSEDEGEGGRRDNRSFKVMIFTGMNFLFIIIRFKTIRKDITVRIQQFLYLLLLKGSNRKRPRLEKGQESMDTDLKKEDDIKSESKGIELSKGYYYFKQL